MHHKTIAWTYGELGSPYASISASRSSSCSTSVPYELSLSEPEHWEESEPVGVTFCMS